MSNPQQPQQIIYQQFIRPPSNGQAVTAMVLGIVAITIGIWSIIPLFGIGAAVTAFIPALLAVVFGHTGSTAAKRTGIGSTQAKTGMILGYITLAIIIGTTLLWTVAIAGMSATQS